MFRIALPFRVSDFFFFVNGSWGREDRPVLSCYAGRGTSHGGVRILVCG